MNRRKARTLHDFLEKKTTEDDPLIVSFDAFHCGGHLFPDGIFRAWHKTSAAAKGGYIVRKGAVHDHFDTEHKGALKVADKGDEVEMSEFAAARKDAQLTRGGKFFLIKYFIFGAKDVAGNEPLLYEWDLSNDNDPQTKQVTTMLANDEVETKLMRMKRMAIQTTADSATQQRKYKDIPGAEELERGDASFLDGADDALDALNGKLCEFTVISSRIHSHFITVISFTFNSQGKSVIWR